MQSWGVSSRYNSRTTLPYPTRSGITGILCAAMGVVRSDKAALEALAGLGMEILAIAKAHPTTSEKPLQAARWVDYHTVGAAYDPDTHRGFIPTRAEDGKPRGTVVTHREYLGDAAFGALLCGDPHLLRDCASALADPKWGLWLGRKCCVPANVICQGLHACRDAAIAHLEGRAGGRVVRLVREVERFEDGTDTLLDLPHDFSNQDPSQRNTPRRVWVGSPSELGEDT